MTGTSQDWSTRRSLLAAVASGMVGLAGCSKSTSDNTGGSTTDNAGERTTTEGTNNQTSTEIQSEKSTSDGREGSVTTSEQNEDAAEVDVQNELEQYYGAWIEVEDPYDNFDIPSSARNKNEIDTSEDRVFSYEELVKLIGDDFYLSEQEGWTIDSFIIGFGMIKNDGHDQSYRETSAVLTWTEDTPNEWGPAMPAEVAFEEGAIEKFFQENVHGYADHSKGINEEMLQYARE